MKGQTILAAHRERVEFSYTYSSMSYRDSLYHIEIPKLTFTGHNEADGKDLDGVMWYVVVGNMKREPYFLVMRSENLTIVAGSKKFE